MWVNRQLFDMIVADNKKLQDEVTFERIGSSRMSASTVELRSQKAKDDITIDWMRHRVNALEKQNAVLLNKAAGIFVPVPEIVPTRPGTMSELPADINHLQSFDDVGDEEAKRLGVEHDLLGFLKQ
jgi:hypothetical protein